MESLLIGYDSFDYIDKIPPCPSSTLASATDTTMPNPAYSTWIRQDRLIFSAIVESLTSSLFPLVQHAKTSYEAWNILATTFARPSRGHIKQIKDLLKHVVKGSQT